MLGVLLAARYFPNNNKHFISDFDSISNLEKEEIKGNGNFVLLNEDREFVDTEEAIKHCQKIDSKLSEIDIFVNEDLGRKDHLINVFNLARKYNAKIIGNKFKIIPIKPNKEIKIIKGNYKYLSMFIFEKTIINNKGLKWDLTKSTYDIDDSTGLISNEINNESATISVDKKIIVFQAND